MSHIYFNAKLNLSAPQIHLWTRIIGWLESRQATEPEFNMLESISKPANKETMSCNTVCCIAGAAVIFSGQRINMREIFRRGPVIEYDWIEVRNKAMKLLGFEQRSLALELLMPDMAGTSIGVGEFNYLTFPRIDSAWAARTIRNYLNTGRVEWEKCNEQN